jgi:hypothetical protein
MQGCEKKVVDLHVPTREAPAAAVLTGNIHLALREGSSLFGDE